LDTHFELSRQRTAADAEPWHADPARARLLGIGIVSGLFGGAALAAPLLVWDWIRTGHRALELPMAVTSWPFGLQHFSHTQNLWWPIVIGAALIAFYAVVSGVVFAFVADRVFGLDGLVPSLAGGAAWSLVNFLFVWDMLLPIARDGTPLRTTLLHPALFVAPNWVWILGFTVFGLVMGATYATLHRSPAVEREHHAPAQDAKRNLGYAA
jgi:hypothetical protein